MAATGAATTTASCLRPGFSEESVEGLLRDKTRPPGIAPVADNRTAAVVAMTPTPPHHEATHWTAPP